MLLVLRLAMVLVFCGSLPVIMASEAASAGQPEGNRSQPLLSVRCDRPILRLEEPPKATSTTLQAVTDQFPPGAVLTYAWRQIQEELSPLAVRMAERPIAFSSTTTEQVVATFPAWGVYAIRVTVTDTAHRITLSRTTWVSVWNNRSTIGGHDALYTAPGILPPPSVRHFTPDPGPFAHPRLLCTPQDWSEIHARTVEGKSIIAAQSYQQLQRSGRPFSEKSKWFPVARDLEAYARAGFTGRPPELPVDPQAKPSQSGDHLTKQFQEFLTPLRDRAVVEWLQRDPSTPWAALEPERKAERRTLARVLAAWCRVYLDSIWKPGNGKDAQGQFQTKHPLFIPNLDRIGGPGQAVDMIQQVALTYDFTAPWMTAAEARVTRNFLIATAANRQTGGRGYVRKINGVLENRGVARGLQQNGTWAGFSDPIISGSLVVAGEESGADPQVVATFLPPGSEALTTGADAYPEATTWPHARRNDVGNLMRQIFHIQDGAVSPWGIISEREAYFTFYSLPLFHQGPMFVRQGGENQFVTGYGYLIAVHLLHHLTSAGQEVRAKLADVISPYQYITHHSGNQDHRWAHTTMLKWLFPDDPAVDLIYATRVNGMARSNHLMTCLFGLDPQRCDLRGALAEVAQAKALPLTKTDPEKNFHVLRSDWSDEAVHVDFDAGGGGGGHGTCEKNSFTLYALGRSWSTAPGFHKIFSNWYSGIQVQHPAWKDCPTTQGYVGMHPCYPPDVEGCDLRTIGASTGKTALGGTGPTRVLEVAEGPDAQWSLLVGDATDAYRYVKTEAKERERVVLEPKDYLYPAGLLDDMISRCGLWRDVLVERRNPYYNFIEGPQYHRYAPTDVACAIRTLLLMRGKRPYVLIVDDFHKGDQPANYRWMMSNAGGTKADNYGNLVLPPFSMELLPGATAGEGILYHQRDAGDTPGLPRLLVRELSGNDLTGQPALRMDQTAFKAPQGLEHDFYLNFTNNSLLIERQQVVDPQFKILLFPHRTGEALPTTTWNAAHTEVTIDLGDGAQDVITFRRQEGDPRTYLDVRRSPGLHR